MTITHHPSDTALAAFAAGALDEGRRLVVAVHLAGCATCRNAVRDFQAVGGIAVEDSLPVPMRADAVERALEAIDAAQRVGASAPVAGADPLAAYSLGQWRWIGPGIHWRRVHIPQDQGTRVFMLKAAPGTSLPHHEHTGLEWTCILKGAFRHEHGCYGARDFDEADETVEHNPVVEMGEDCICLVAMQGELRFKSLIGRLLQPLVRI